MSCPVCPDIKPTPAIPVTPISPNQPMVAPCGDTCSKRTNVHCCEGDKKCNWDTKKQKCSYNIPSWVYQVLIWLVVLGVAVLTWYLTGEILLGVLIIVVYIVFLVMKKVYGNPNVKTNTVPSKDYMQYIGGVCPDQWIHTTTKDGKDYCKNVYNMTVRDDKKCYSDNENTKTFPEIKGWPPAGDALKQRCDWRLNCGPKEGIYASWTDLNCP